MSFIAPPPPFGISSDSPHLAHHICPLQVSGKIASATGAPFESW
jgi:hypothetical protein